MNQKEVYVTKPSLPLLKDYLQYLEPIWNSAILTNNGPMHKQLTRDMAAYLHADNLELYINGHMALDIALKSLCLKGEVITTPFTFASTVHAIVMNGLTPVFCDIRADTCNIDEEKIEALINENTCAILPVHVYGNPCNCMKIHEIAEKYQLKVIYDAAHAFGVTVNGKSLSCEGDLSMYSFHATKVFHTIEGGALAFRDSSLKQTLKNLKNFGIKNSETIALPGMNGKMNELCAAMGLCNLTRVEEYISKRRQIVMRYIKHLSGFKGIRLIDYAAFEKNGVKLNYGYFVIFVEEAICGFNRDQLFDHFTAHGIHARKYFWPLAPDYACYKNSYSNCSIPVARKIASEVLSLPIYPDLDMDTVDKICGLIYAMNQKYASGN